MSQPRLLSVSAFYKNDLPRGIGIQLLQDYAPDLNRFMLEIAVAYRLMWRASVIDGTQHLLIRDSVTRLDALGRRDKQQPLSDSDVTSIIGNVWLLEEVGMIHSNEYNGMQYIAEGGHYDAPRLRLSKTGPQG